MVSFINQNADAYENEQSQQKNSLSAREDFIVSTFNTMMAS